MSQPDPPPAPVNEAPPDFNICISLAIEMLKRGAQEVDIHPFGLRLCRPAGKADSGPWSIGFIPLWERERYVAAMSNPVADPQPDDPRAGLGDFDDTDTPMTGGGARDGAGEAAGLGPTAARK